MPLTSSPPSRAIQWCLCRFEKAPAIVRHGRRCVMDIKCSEPAPELACSYRIARTTLPFLFSPPFSFPFLFSRERDNRRCINRRSIDEKAFCAEHREMCAHVFRCGRIERRETDFMEIRRSLTRNLHAHNTRASKRGGSHCAARFLL